MDRFQLIVWNCLSKVYWNDRCRKVGAFVVVVSHLLVVLAVDIICFVQIVTRIMKLNGWWKSIPMSANLESSTNIEMKEFVLVRMLINWIKCGSHSIA